MKDSDSYRWQAEKTQHYIKGDPEDNDWSNGWEQILKNTNQENFSEIKDGLKLHVDRATIHSCLWNS